MIKISGVTAIGKVPGANGIRVIKAKDGTTHIAARTADDINDITVFSGLIERGYTPNRIKDMKQAKIFSMDQTAVVLGNALNGLSYAVYKEGWPKATPVGTPPKPVCESFYFSPAVGKNRRILTVNSAGVIRAISEIDGVLDLDATVATGVKVRDGKPFTAGAIDTAGNKSVVWLDKGGVWGAVAVAGATAYQTPVKVVDLPPNVKVTTLTVDYNLVDDPVVHVAYQSTEPGTNPATVNLMRMNRCLGVRLAVEGSHLTIINRLPDSCSWYINRDANANIVYVDPIDNSGKFISSTPAGWAEPTTLMPVPTSKMAIAGNDAGDVAVGGIRKTGDTVELLYLPATDPSVTVPAILDWERAQRVEQVGAANWADIALHIDEHKTISLALLDESGKVYAATASVAK